MSSELSEPKPWPAFPLDLTDASFDRSTKAGLEGWIQWRYCQSGFHSDGIFKGWKWLKDHLIGLNGGHSGNDVFGGDIRRTVNSLRFHGNFPMVDKHGKPMANNIKEIFKSQKPSTELTQSNPGTGAIAASVVPMPGLSALPFADPSNITGLHGTPPSASVTNTGSAAIDEGPRNDLLARQLEQMQSLTHTAIHSMLLDQEAAPAESECGLLVSGSVLTPDSANGSEIAVKNQELTSSADIPDFEAMEFLLASNNYTEGARDDHHTVTQHAPLLDGNIIQADNTSRYLPQFGLLGNHDQNVDDSTSKLFLNTNVPFSAFVCGVQGSGKSHTTSCILENCLVPSNKLGRLQNPLSALVFSYGLFTGNGAGFSISEAAFLGSPNPQFGNAHVKKINVLVCQTNFLRISKLYRRLPNITVSCFKLDPKNLDIDLMLNLMNVDGSQRVPLYMAQIMNILRHMAVTSKSFDYRVFKAYVQNQRFDHVQQNMLDMRLSLLESFLDLNGTYRDDTFFKPGEITIMDMSCPFVDVNTACIMFKCGLQRYLQTGTSGKMVVLDEAHKYMLDVPGARDLNETLLQTIRLQRHFGTRVVISTQEPTLLTDLIALCSITVIHRFSSPEWLNAIKKHIRIPDQEHGALMERIESLPTGTAIVYSPNAVLGYIDEQLQKGTGKMMEVKMRKRITADGGQSVLAV